MNNIRLKILWMVDLPFILLNLLYEDTISGLSLNILHLFKLSSELFLSAVTPILGFHG
jgi:hypothetical protein